MSLATDDVVKVEVWDVVDKGKNNSDTFISEILLTLITSQDLIFYSPLQLLTCVENIVPLPKTICTENFYQMRVNFTQMDQSECFVSLGLLLGKVYPIGVNFTISNSQNRALMWAASSQNNYNLNISLLISYENLM